MSSWLATIITIVVHTPLWVWPLYVLLLFLGFQRTRDSQLPLWRVLILPLVVTGFAAFTFIGAGLGGLPPLLLGVAVGGAGGWRLERDGDTRRMPDGRLWLPGEWWTFALILLVLIFRYGINVVPALNPWLNADPIWRFSTLFVSAGLSALFLGRTAARLRGYFAAIPKMAN